MTDAEYYAFGVGCMRLTLISHLLNELGIPITPHVFFDSQLLIVSIKNRIQRWTAVAHTATKYYLAADMASDGEIYLSYVPTAEMLAVGFTKLLPKPPVLKQYAVTWMIGTALRYALGIGTWNGLRNGLGNGSRIGTGNGIGNAMGE